MLSFRSNTFQNTYDKLEEEVSSGNITSIEERDSFLKQQDIDPQEYDSAYQQFKQEGFRKEAAVPFAGTGPLGVAGRIVGRFAGETLEPIDVVTGGLATDILDSVLKQVPESVRNFIDEASDPYHGDGFGIVEQIGGTLPAYLTVGKALLKGGTTAVKQGSKIFGDASAGAKIGSKSLISRSMKDLSKPTVISERRKRLQRAGEEGVAFAGAATLIEDPKENAVNILREAFPESTEFLERLSVNPEDSEAKQYLQAMINNLGLALPFGAISLANAYKAPLLNAVSKLPLINRIPANFSSRLGTDDETINLMVEATNATQAGLIRATGIAADLEAVAAKRQGGLTDKLRDTLNNALQGDKKSLSKLTKQEKELVEEMRLNVDNLSAEAGLGTKGNLKAAIEENGGVYITRSYDFFDDPAFKQNTIKNFNKFKSTGQDTNGVFTAALNSIKQSGGYDDTQAMAMLKKILRMEDEKALFDDNLQGLVNYNSVITAKSGEAKKNLPDAVRVLLGEVKDPFKNYVKTVGNLSRITGEQKFLSGIAKHLQSKFGDELAEGVVDLTEVGAERLGRVLGRGAVSRGEVLNPLEGVLATKEYKDAIEYGLNTIYSDSKFMNAFAKAKGLSQAAKTAFNVPTHGRNVMGNVMLMMANGFVGPNGYREALQTTAANLSGKTNKQLAEKMAEYVELGIANSGVNVNTIRNNLKQLSKDPDAALLNTINRENVKGTRTILGVGKKVLDLYQAEDDFFKIAHFEKTLNYLKNTAKYKGKDLKDPTIMAQLKRDAAQRTRDLMPNYNLVPKFFKDLRKMPIGDFLSFPAEMTRITKNLVKYSIQDVMSGDPALMTAGAKRLAGLTAMGAAPTLISEKSRVAMGITEDQAESLENLGKDWEYKTDKIYLSPIQKDANGHEGVNYFSFGPIDPFSYLKRGAELANALVIAGVSDDPKVEAATDKLALSTLDAIAGPFLAPSMVTNSLVTALFPDRYGNSLVDDALKGELGDRLGAVVKSFSPGFVDQLMRRLDYNQSFAKRNPYGMEAIKNNGVTYKRGEVDLAATFGLKRDYLDITASTRNNITPLIREINSSSNELNRMIRTDPTGLSPMQYAANYAAEMANASQIFDERNINSQKYLDSQKNKYDAMQRLRAVLEDYNTVFGDNYTQELYRGLSNDGLTDPSSYYENIEYAQANRFKPDTFEFNPQFFITQPQIDWEKMNEIYGTLNGVTLFDD